MTLAGGMELGGAPRPERRDAFCGSSLEEAFLRFEPLDASFLPTPFAAGLVSLPVASSFGPSEGAFLGAMRWLWSGCGQQNRIFAYEGDGRDVWTN